MPPLSFYAGSTALKTIQNNGISADMFSAILGASGGPKWFVLTGLDKVLFNDFLHSSNNHIDIIGSSVGAFRASCFMQEDPGAAINRLAEAYSKTVYSDKPSAEEITEKGIELLYYMMGPNGVKEALEAVNKTAHIIIARCHGLTSYESKVKQFAGLAIAAGRNAISRKKLEKSFTRLIMSTNHKGLSFSEKVNIKTEQAVLNKDNYLDALMASGSIPAVIKGVRNLAGVKKGMFRDGGIIDYHFDMRINTPKLVLYPHFYSKITPGWFDKSIKSRQCHPASYDNVLLVAPSEEFVSTLPYSKIPDRKDFETMAAEQRQSYWETVISESDRLAEHFFKVINSPNPSQYIKPINLKR